MGVAVRLSDINGPKGGLDKHCHLQLRLRGLPDIVVKDTEAICMWRWIAPRNAPGERWGAICGGHAQFRQAF